ncbi:MAG: hypothetical protein SF123_15710, partial [Chloroflexota bacterium]|nr:hypothetical protein [Chloroflexota bacterium]
DGEMLPAFTPLKRKRMGTFTPFATPESDDQQRATAADDMRGEELEQHISDTLHGTRTHEQPGALRVSGTADVASVMGDVIRLLGGAGSADHLTVAALMAQALNITPADDGKPPVRPDLARFGMYADQAARLGLSPDQTERVAREVKESPERALSPALRSELVEQTVRAGSGREDAEHAVQRLELAAHLLPNSIAAYGAMTVPVVTVEPQITVAPVIQIDSTDQDTPRYDSAALSGSETLRGGDR